MRFSTIFLIGALVFGIAAETAHADWMNPTSTADCNNGLQPLYDRRKAAFKAKRQCNKDYQEEFYAGRTFYRTYPCGSLPAHESGYMLETCSQHAQPICQAKLEITRRTDICQRKLQEHYEFQQAQRKQQEELERIQRENERIARQNERQGGSVGNPGSQVFSSPSGPANLADTTRIAGHGMARLRGVRMTGPSGAYSLSSAMSIVGNRVITGLNQRALGELDTALQEFNASNPRPTASQLEDFYAQRSDLAGQYASHMTRVQNTDYNLPLDDKSAVVGAYTNAIVQLVQKRNSGEIDEPIAFLGAAVTTVLAVRAYKEAKERAEQQRSERSVNAPKQTVSEELRERRQAVLASVREERARIAEAGARTEQLRRQNEARRQAKQRRRKAEFDAQKEQIMARHRSQREEIRRQARRQKRFLQTLTIIGKGVGVAAGLNGGSKNSNRSPTSGTDCDVVDPDGPPRPECY